MLILVEQAVVEFIKIRNSLPIYNIWPELKFRNRLQPILEISKGWNNMHLVYAKLRGRFCLNLAFVLDFPGLACYLALK